MALHTRSNSFPSRPHPIIEEFMNFCLPLTQQALAQEKNEKWTNELLDGSLRRLDVCGTAKDALSNQGMRPEPSIHHAKKAGGETGALTSEVRKYYLQEDGKKTIEKAMKNSREPKTDPPSLPSTTTPNSSWSLVSKMMQSKKVVCEEETEVNEFAEVDASLQSLIGHKTSKSHSQSALNAHNQLEKLDACIQDQEDGLERLFRQMIKTRVSLLNILNH
ncbi:uncharacterized protein Pyn_01856 [Prunus yedoensis var. nudiflora]|uniref:Uncharacterized protein n=1 Tax=Prunus yedoensis var. nudiflora TaxID=2094558 RepID=A0A314U996_PRUYE|nr:uncharacterized protein Pyn_01856 [Prunus yedoensis var. nudiflora]